MFLDISEAMWGLIASFIVALVLIGTFLKELEFKKNQTKMEYIKLYNDLDTKLRNTDKELRKNGISDDEIYHNMVQIIITVMNIVKFHKTLSPKFWNRFRVEFDLEYFRGWIKYGYTLTDHLICRDHKDQDDLDIAEELKKWCDKKGEDEAKKVKGEKEKEDAKKKWGRKNIDELPSKIICLGKTKWGRKI